MKDGAAHPAMRVLVVEDTDTVRALVVNTLLDDGCDVEEASNANEALAQISTGTADVVVLDLGLPDGSGLDLLRELVAAGVPVVVLTSRGDETDRVLGLELGAEEYMVKPFFPRELATRVRRAAARVRPTNLAQLDAGGLIIDRGSREVSLDGDLVDLTDREFDLLVYLASSPRTVFSRDDLLRAVWKSKTEWQSPKTVTEHVRRLRQKIEREPRKPKVIVTVGASGYRFDPRQPP